MKNPKFNNMSHFLAIDCNATKKNSIKVPLAFWTYQLGQKIASIQSNVKINKSIYLNSLAVSAVQNYLAGLNIPTELPTTYYINSHQINTDLLICSAGYFQCKPVLPNQTNLNLSISSNSRFLGTIAVQFQDILDYVELLGFIPASFQINSPRSIQISEIQPLDLLLEYF